MAIIDNLVSYWKLDESSGNAADAHGANTLTNNNTVTYSAAKINNGANLALASSQSLSISDAAQTGLDITSDISFSLWCSVASSMGAGEDRTLVGKRLNTGNQRSYLLEYSENSGALRLRLQLSSDGTDTGSTAEILTVTAFDLGTSTLHHVVCTWKASTKTMTAYMDGSVVNTAIGTIVGSIFNSTSSFALGAWQTETLWFWDGQLDEVGIWSRELTSAEVTTLYNGGAGLAYPFSVNPLPSVSDSITVSESITVRVNGLPSISDSITVTEGIQIAYSLPSPIFDSITVTEGIQINYSLPSPIFDSVTVTEDIVLITGNLANVSDLVTITEDVQVLIPTFVPSVFDSATLTENVNLVIPTLYISVFDSATVSEDITPFVIIPSFIFESVTVSEAVFIVKVFPALLFEAVTVSESVTFNILVSVSVSDLITASEVFTTSISSYQLPSSRPQGSIEFAYAYGGTV